MNTDFKTYGKLLTALVAVTGILCALHPNETQQKSADMRQAFSCGSDEASATIADYNTPDETLYLKIKQEPPDGPLNLKVKYLEKSTSATPVPVLVFQDFPDKPPGSNELPLDEMFRKNYRDFREACRSTTSHTPLTPAIVDQITNLAKVAQLDKI